MLIQTDLVSRLESIRNPDYYYEYWITACGIYMSSAGKETK